MTPVPFMAHTDGDVTVTLPDGATIRVRVLVTGASRVDGMADQNGNQAYAVHVTTAPGAVIPRQEAVKVSGATGARGAN